MNLGDSLSVSVARNPRKIVSFWVTNETNIIPENADAETKCRSL
jgi:hypothetical protein